MGAVVHKLWSQKGPYSRCTRPWNLPQEIRDELALRSKAGSPRDQTLFYCRSFVLYLRQNAVSEQVTPYT